MSRVGQIEIATQKRLLKVFQNQLDYEYLGDWQDREGNSNVEPSLICDWLNDQGHSLPLINKVLHKLNQAKSIGGVTQLYDANRAVYDLLRYGVKVKETVGENAKTVWLIDWENPENKPLRPDQQNRGLNLDSDTKTTLIGGGIVIALLAILLQ